MTVSLSSSAMSDEPRARVAYISSDELRRAADRLPSNPGRSSMVHDLIEAYGLLDREPGEDDASSETARAAVYEPRPAAAREIARFHDPDYVAALLNSHVTRSNPDSDDRPRKRSKLNDYDDTPTEQHHLETGAGFGLGYDCPIFPELDDYCRQLSGGAIEAARVLRDGYADIAVLWDGGRHHATKSRAAGFCYVNDIVLAVLELQRIRQGSRKGSPRLSKAMVIDLDLHHGDGTAEAFRSNAKVLTVSCHAWYRGFFPSTPEGQLHPPDLPPGHPAQGTTLNVPVTKPGLGDASFLRIVQNCIKPIFLAFQPDCVVVQCGVDGLSGDPFNEWNLSLSGYGSAIQEIMAWCGRKEREAHQNVAISPVPLLLVGGGGYNHANAARAWTYLTSVALGRTLQLESEISEVTQYWDDYAPDFTLDVPGSGKVDENTEEDLARIEAAFVEHAERLSASTQTW